MSIILSRIALKLTEAYRDTNRDAWPVDIFCSFVNKVMETFPFRLGTFPKIVICSIFLYMWILQTKCFELFLFIGMSLSFWNLYLMFLGHLHSLSGFWILFRTSRERIEMYKDLNWSASLIVLWLSMWFFYFVFLDMLKRI